MASFPLSQTPTADQLAAGMPDDYDAFLLNIGIDPFTTTMKFGTIGIPYSWNGRTILVTQPGGPGTAVSAVDVTVPTSGAPIPVAPTPPALISPLYTGVNTDTAIVANGGGSMLSGIPSWLWIAGGGYLAWRYMGRRKSKA